MNRAERDAILRQGVVLPETPRQRRELAALAEDIETIELTGKPLPVRARHFRPSAEAYLVATRGPLPYMLRLREIEQRTAGVEESVREAWGRSPATARAMPTASPRVDAAAEAWSFDAERPRRAAQPLVPGRVPAADGPRRGDFALVNGRDYRLEPFDAGWVLERPADLSSVPVSVP
jgi:hypothetical protein